MEGLASRVADRHRVPTLFTFSERMPMRKRGKKSVRPRFRLGGSLRPRGARTACPTPLAHQPHPRRTWGKPSFSASPALVGERGPERQRAATVSGDSARTVFHRLASTLPAGGGPNGDKSLGSAVNLLSPPRQHFAGRRWPERRQVARICGEFTFTASPTLCRQAVARTPTSRSDLR